MAKLVSYALWCLIYLFSMLPKSFFYFISDVMAFLLRRVFKYRASVVYVNLAKSFPHLEYGEIDRIAKEYYKYMCDIMVESVWQISASAKQQCAMVDIEGIELMDEMVAKHEKVVLLMAHRGNWEMMGVFLGENEKRYPDSFSNYPITVTYKVPRGKLSNFLFEKIRMNEFKKYQNNGSIVGAKQFLRHVLKTTGKNTYAFIADQYPRVGGVPVKFLNQDTFFFSGAEAIACKIGMPVVYMDMVREKRGKYRMVFKLITENARECKSGEVTARYAKLLEESIMAEKYNWLWSHKRWKRGFTEEDKAECNKILLSLLDSTENR